jgi:hypothetical protein
VKITGRLFLPFFMAVLLLSNPVSSTLAFDGDGDFDASDTDNDSGDDAESHNGNDLGHDGEGHGAEERDGDYHGHQGPDGHTDGSLHGTENDRDHHGHARQHYADGWPIWGPALGFAPAYGGFGWGSFGSFGGPGYGAFDYGMPYYPPAYYSSPVMVAPSPPPTYVQRNTPAQGSHPGYWYYCRDPEGYYPHVQECPGGWEQVTPQAPEG